QDEGGGRQPRQHRPPRAEVVGHVSLFTEVSIQKPLNSCLLARALFGIVWRPESVGPASGVGVTGVPPVSGRTGGTPVPPDARHTNRKPALARSVSEGPHDDLAHASG